MTTSAGRPVPTDLPASSSDRENGRTAPHATRLARRRPGTLTGRIGERRAERRERPFPSSWQRARSAIELLVVVVLLGLLAAALAGALLVAVVVLASHVLDG